MVVDCGGGTVDITVHEMENEESGTLRELYKAAGGPHGSTGLFFMKFISSFPSSLESKWGASPPNFRFKSPPFGFLSLPAYLSICPFFLRCFFFTSLPCFIFLCVDCSVKNRGEF